VAEATSIRNVGVDERPTHCNDGNLEELQTMITEFQRNHHDVIVSILLGDCPRFPWGDADDMDPGDGDDDEEEEPYE
jgi:hypothetical protein